jgi:hypothetical protein
MAWSKALKVRKRKRREQINAGLVAWNPPREHQPLSLVKNFNVSCTQAEKEIEKLFSTVASESYRGIGTTGDWGTRENAAVENPRNQLSCG